MSENLSVIKSEAGPMAPAAPSVASMLQAVVERGISAENVGAMEKLVELYERVEAKNAEKAFARAFVALQADLRSVKAIREVPNNDGGIRYRFAPFEAIMAEVGPKAEKHGFTITFSTEYQENRLVKFCTLQHIEGHSRTTKFAVRVGSGPPKASECQADGAASTYAKRFALCDALNIQIDHDVDANAQGTEITPEQAAELKARVKATKADEVAFLKFAGAKTYEEIMSTKLGLLDDLLSQKERKAAAKRITAAQANDLRARVLATGADQSDFLGTFKTFEEIPAANYATMEAALKKLEVKA